MSDLIKLFPPKYLVLDGDVLRETDDAMEFSKCINDPKMRRIARADGKNDEGKEVSISTVFLCLMHIGGPFETMIFGGDHDQEMVRAHTVADSLLVHREMCRRVSMEGFKLVSTERDGTRRAYVLGNEFDEPGKEPPLLEDKT